MEDNLHQIVNIKRNIIATTWSEPEENILQIWAEKASGWAWLHDKAQRHYSNQSDRLIYPGIIINTVSGGIGFLNTGSYILPYFIACLNIIVAILISFQKFLRSTEKAENHSRHSIIFSSFTRKISLELTLKPEDRMNCIQFCKMCRNEYDTAVADSPIVPDSIITRFRKEFANEKNKPEVANGLFHFTTYPRNKGFPESPKSPSSVILNID
jgi:hypothetical protein